VTAKELIQRVRAKQEVGTADLAGALKVLYPVTIAQALGVELNPTFDPELPITLGNADMVPASEVLKLHGRIKSLEEEAELVRMKKQAFAELVAENRRLRALVDKIAAEARAPKRSRLDRINVGWDPEGD